MTRGSGILSAQLPTTYGAAASRRLALRLSIRWRVMMTRRMLIVLLLGASLLPGCGRSDHPSIRRVSFHPVDGVMPAAGPNPPQVQVEEETCPESLLLSGGTQEAASTIPIRKPSPRRSRR